MTTFDDSTRTVAEIAKNIILNTTERFIPLTPENYRVWFEYFLGSNQELKASIDELIASENSFSQEINERLYTEYLKGDKKEILQEVHKETHKIFQNIFQTTLSTSDLTSNYSAKMKEYSNKLDEAKDLTQIQHFIVDQFCPVRKKQAVTVCLLWFCLSPLAAVQITPLKNTF